MTAAFIDSFASGGGLTDPVDLAFGPDGNLYVTDQISNQVLQYDGTTGAFMDVFIKEAVLKLPGDYCFGQQFRNHQHSSYLWHSQVWFRRWFDEGANALNQVLALKGHNVIAQGAALGNVAPANR